MQAKEMALKNKYLGLILREADKRRTVRLWVQARNSRENRELMGRGFRGLLREVALCRGVKKGVLRE